MYASDWHPAIRVKMVQRSRVSPKFNDSRAANSAFQIQHRMTPSFSLGTVRNAPRVWTGKTFNSYLGLIKVKRTFCDSRVRSRGKNVMPGTDGINAAPPDPTETER